MGGPPAEFAAHLAEIGVELDVESWRVLSPLERLTLEREALERSEGVVPLSS